MRALPIKCRQAGGAGLRAAADRSSSNSRSSSSSSSRGIPRLRDQEG